MTNNKVYKIIEQVDLNNPENSSYRYLRLENNKILYSYRFNSEIEEIDFTKSIGEIWRWITDTYVGLTYSSYRTDYMTLTTSTRKNFEYFYIDSSFVPPDTIAILDVGPDIYQRGIGETQIGADYFLTGVILNGVKYGIITDVKDNGSVKPDRFTLSQNYPNPFNPSTQIRYEIAKSSFVQLKVFNSLGQEVAQLVNKVQTSGTYEVSFNAKSLPSGLYLYKLQAGEYNAVKKMLLLK